MNSKRCTPFEIVPRGGFEPPTLWVWITRYYQLSYLGKWCRELHISAWRHHFSQHQVYDSDFNRTGCLPYFTWRDFGHLNLYLSKESNLHTQIHGQDLQSWTSPIYVVNRHFKTIPTKLEVGYNLRIQVCSNPLTILVRVLLGSHILLNYTSQIFNILCNQDSGKDNHPFFLLDFYCLPVNVLENDFFWAVDRIRTCEGIYALLIGSQAPSTTRRLPHICKREYRI